jgi:rhodanese-related sulfurtransferase
MIEVEELRKLIDEGAQVVDVMSRTDYEDSHLPGAIHISLKELDAHSAAQLDRTGPVVTYCADYL